MGWKESFLLVGVLTLTRMGLDHILIFLRGVNFSLGRNLFWFHIMWTMHLGCVDVVEWWNSFAVEGPQKQYGI